ncbi:NOP5/NOP56 family protein [Halovenus sp. HT40]|uniref:NOP5/NOP56 family protein n=1 Tax=Halovenus sp. HT40 TaxID=3126691 RepID=UPI00300F6162
MNDDESAASGWFAGVDPGDTEAARAAIRDGEAPETADWPTLAVESGFADTETEYYDLLHEATTAATRAEVREREQADDQQLIHAIRALDDCQRVRNELTERVGEWAGSQDSDADVDSEYIADLAERDPDNPMEERLVSLAGRIVDLEDETQSLQTVVDSTATSVAPNLTALAGAELAARLIALAGGLDELAKKPAGTVQVLGAEDALFAHLRGGAPSPKHGVIYTHEYVRGIRPEDRGSAARALAGKLAIAARIDNYSGEYRPELEDELDDRIERIRAREHE